MNTALWLWFSVYTSLFLWFPCEGSVYDYLEFHTTGAIANADSDKAKFPPIEDSAESVLIQEEGYEHLRNTLIKDEELLISGAHLQLTDDEKLANRIFMHYKELEIENGMTDANSYAPALHFFKAKPLIEKSAVFNFLKAMPKGALLHAHNSAAVSVDWIINNVTYMPGMMRCVTDDNVQILTFRTSPNHQCSTQYAIVAYERQQIPDYDMRLRRSLNLYTEYPEVEYPTGDVVWQKFEDIFRTLSDVLRYLPVFKAFHWRLMEEMYEDKIMYAEIRMSFKELYDQDGGIMPETLTIPLLYHLVEQFKAEHPGFLGFKVIYTVYRNSNYEDIQKRYLKFKSYHKSYPNFVIGFDLVGQEDKRRYLHEYVQLVQDMPTTAKVFFHAGETNWYGSGIDLNLVDAILLNTTRIGHGYALLKHPLLCNAVKSRDIALEISPISNQVLNLVHDLRNHPAGYFISQSIPMVIANDDPGFWDAKGLSYDYYYAIMAFAPNNAGLKTLKHLVWSAIKYTGLDEWAKQRAFDTLQSHWNEFIRSVVEGRVI